MSQSSVLQKFYYLQLNRNIKENQFLKYREFRTFVYIFFVLIIVERNGVINMETNNFSISDFTSVSVIRILA